MAGPSARTAAIGSAPIHIRWLGSKFAPTVSPTASRSRMQGARRCRRSDGRAARGRACGRPDVRVRDEVAPIGDEHVVPLPMQDVAHLRRPFGGDPVGMASPGAPGQPDIMHDAVDADEAGEPDRVARHRIVRRPFSPGCSGLPEQLSALMAIPWPRGGHEVAAGGVAASSRRGRDAGRTTSCRNRTRRIRGRGAEPHRERRRTRVPASCR